jgi:hypothetical protein
MRKADIKSLIWLYRWYGGRSQRLDEIHQAHLSNLEQLVVEELGGMPKSETQLSFYGFSIVVSFGTRGIEVIAIHPPDLLNGDQLKLFAEEKQAWEIEEVQVATAY